MAKKGQKERKLGQTWKESLRENNKREREIMRTGRYSALPERPVRNRKAKRGEKGLSQQSLETQTRTDREGSFLARGK